MTGVGTDVRRKPGRPRKFAQGRVNATVRFTPAIYAELKIAAENNRRSVSEEVELRIERAIHDEPLVDIARGIGQVGEELQSIAQELLQKAMARIDELEKTRGLDEAMLERAISGVLAKMRLTFGNNGAVEGSGSE